MFKRIFSAALSVLTAAMLFAGCTGDSPAADNDKPLVVTTIFPVYDWVRQISGNSTDIELKMLADNGADMHSFQPTAEDIMQISSCDLFIYIGGESDKWTEDILKEAVNKDMKVINLLEVLGDSAKTEELAEGMQESEHEHEDDEDDSHEEYDEHIWLSLKNAEISCKEIAGALSEIDEENSGAYAENLREYSEKLDALDKEYAAAAQSSERKTILFADRFPFRYLTDDYGIEYYAAFDGCSSETEASFETVTFLAKKTDELDLHTVLITESSDGKIAKTVISNTKSKDQQILSLNSMQSVSSDDIKNGETYLSVMESNLETLKSALK